MIKPLLKELRHVLLHTLLAVTVWVLPHNLHFRAFRLIARLRWLIPVQTGLSSMLKHLPELQPYRHSITLGHALHQIVDQADYYLTHKYGNNWLKQNLQIEGRILSAHLAGKPAPVLLTPHYGQGFWALYYFRHVLGLPVAWLHLPPPAVSQLGQKLASRHGRKRIRRVEMLAGCRPIPTGGSIQAMQSCLQQGNAVLAMPDVPPAPSRSHLPISLVGRQAAIPAGTLQMAARERAPVYMYTVYLDRSTGKRKLKLNGPYIGLSAEDLAAKFAEMLNTALSTDPAAWHLWPWIELFLGSEPANKQGATQHCSGQGSNRQGK